MRLPTLDPQNAGDIDIEQVKKMVDLFMEKGFTYFDTAWMYYCGFNSENAAKTALVDCYPRDSFTLATKLNAAFFNTLEERDTVFNEQLNKTGAGYFDYYLLHGLDGGSYEKFEQFDCFNWLLDKKAKGLVKIPGFSFHGTADLLDDILTRHPEMEFVQLQINYLDWDSQWIQSKACYDVAVKHGKPVIVMEPVKADVVVRAIVKGLQAPVHEDDVAFFQLAVRQHLGLAVIDVAGKPCRLCQLIIVGSTCQQVIGLSGTKIKGIACALH